MIGDSNSYEEILERIPNRRDRFIEHNEILLVRLEEILPVLLKDSDFDTWLVLGREYNEDPVMFTLLPAAYRNASRYTAFVFKGTDRYVLSPYGKMMTGFYTSVWDVTQGDFWTALRKLLKDIGAENVGVNFSSSIALADGVTHTLFKKLEEVVGDFVRLTGAEDLVVNWLQTRTKRELDLYRDLDKIAHAIIAKAFSRDAIFPGITTTSDIEWSLRDLAERLGLETWFGPDVDFQRKGLDNPRSTGVVCEGDFLHCDFGFHYNGLATDTQQMFYLPLKREDRTIDELRRVIRDTNFVQDTLARDFIVGLTGNDVLCQTLKEVKRLNLEAMIYTHPIGFNGHGAGPTIGLWNNQKWVEGSGELKLRDMSCFAMELNCRTNVDSWEGQGVFGFLEETVAFREGHIDYLDGRQTEVYLI